MPIGCIAWFPVLAILHKPDPLGAPEWILPFHSFSRLLRFSR
jgi:ABC-2 type transport system permease protein